MRAPGDTSRGEEQFLPGAAALFETLLVCPACRASLRWYSAIECTRCGRAYARLDSIPLLLEGSEDRHKATQAAYFDAADEAWEIERPNGAPRLHAWLLAEKFRRAISELDVRGRTVVAACAGSGMDAEFLARAGARVIAVDISTGAARRVNERARRHSVPITPVVADIEHLPFPDQSVDISFVHDGLHHLERPELGLAELARIARVGISVSEPAQAALTRLAVRAGVALEEEEAGNRVARLAPQLVEAELERHGFRTVRSDRYAMYYRHEPGRVARLLSAPIAYPIARVAFAGANRVIGSVGNKLVVQGVRVERL
jgi:ubiquinone/menaquinone biosynthesis C-methylase UbiE/uncharacterized protein YbaR (Trm112 family)